MSQNKGFLGKSSTVKCKECGKVVKRKWAISDVKKNEKGTGIVVYTCVRCK